jgi:hypothetical protein
VVSGSSSRSATWKAGSTFPLWQFNVPRDDGKIGGPRVPRRHGREADMVT